MNGADSSAPPLLSSPTFPHHSAAPRRTAPRAYPPVRNGMAGPPAGTHAEPGAPVCVPRGFPGGKDPPTPSPTMPKATGPPTAAPPRQSPAAPSNRSACRVLALALLTDLYNPRDRAHLARQGSLGVFPFLRSPPWGKKRRGVGEERRSREGEAAPRDVAGAPRPEAIRVRGEPYPSPREKLKSSHRVGSRNRGRSRAPP
jgi:hypothetical protein